MTEPLPKHWRLGCSNAKRWVNCPGSQWAVEPGDDARSTRLADLGTLGHRLVHDICFRRDLQLTVEERILYESFEPDERNWFKRCVKECVRFVQQLRIETWGEAYIEFEKKIQSDCIRDHGGTMDILIATSDTLHVVDFKFGGVAVEAGENEQLMCYLNLARQEFPGRMRFFGTIMQPSYRGAETIEFSYGELEDFLERAIAASQSDELHGNPEWCRYCPLLPTCKEAARTAVRAVDEFGPLTTFVNAAGRSPSPEQIEQLERIVLMHKMAKDAYDKASALLKQWHNDGAELKYHHVSSASYRNWSYEKLPAIMETIPDEYRAQAVHTDIVTPAALQKLMGLTKADFDAKFGELLDIAVRRSLKTGARPTTRELAEDLPIYVES